jgi:hypothetical protein
MLISCHIESLHVKPKFDRFTMAGGHDQDYTLTIANAGAGRTDGDWLKPQRR